MKIEIGMRVCVHCFWGTITDIKVYTKPETNREVTNFKVKFDECEELANT